MPALRSHREAAQTDTISLVSVEPARLGMPELCRAGLSENWLWKACGHRHWLALAAAHGLERPDFRDGEGERLYPAFTDIRLEQGRLDTVREHEILDFDVDLRRSGRTRFSSRVTVLCSKVVVAVLVMESTFVRRMVDGRNHSTARGLVARPSPLLPPPSPEIPFRTESWIEANGFERTARREIASLILDPTPHEDFNGADFLYFSTFQALVDRAEWIWLRRADPLFTTTGRRIIFAGNIELSDRVRAILCGQQNCGADVRTWVELVRESDDALIGLAFTHRRPALGRPLEGCSK